MPTSTPPRERATSFDYLGWERTGHDITARYRTRGRLFEEKITLDPAVDCTTDGLDQLIDLWSFIAGLSYYKAGAAHHIDCGPCPLGPAGRALLQASVRDGLGEFAVRNDLFLDDVTISASVPLRTGIAVNASSRVLTPFGGGIDSIVTVEALRGLVDQSLFIVSPATGRFAPLEAAAALSALPTLRAVRTLDPAIVRGDATFFNGHVPVTAMVTLLAVITAVGTGHGGVAMSNEHSASLPNMWRGDHAINHQWSKSWIAEQLLAAAVAECVGDGVVVASYLRDRSEVWVAQQFAALTDYHPHFRSCNRAFATRVDDRATTWCGTCDKCLFIHLVLAPFVDRLTLARYFASEPLANPELAHQLITLLGGGHDRKPFECVGDPDECRVALAAVVAQPAWREVAHLVDIAQAYPASESLSDHLAPRGESRVPAAWLH